MLGWDIVYVLNYWAALFHLVVFKGKRDLQLHYWIMKSLSAACENDWTINEARRNAF